MTAPEHPELAARITLVVDVHKERDPGMSGELPHDYLVIRDASTVMAQTFINPGIFSVVSEGIFDDADPDGLMTAAVTQGLFELAPPIIDHHALAEELRKHYPKHKHCGGCAATWGEGQSPGVLTLGPVFTDFRAHQADIVARWLEGTPQ